MKEQLMKMEKLNVGVIGLGRMGRIHARNLQYRIPRTNLLAVSDIAAETARQIGSDLEVPQIETDYRRILENRDIDAVLICSSTNTHARIMTEAAAAGKQIFCEKPIDLEMAVIDQALAAVKKAGVKLQIGFNRRYDPNYRKLRELVRDGAIGTPYTFRIISRDPQPAPPEYIKICGGIFLDMMIHEYDLARFIMDDEIDEIMAIGNCLIDPAFAAAGDVDNALVTFKFKKSGALGNIENSRKAVYGYDQRIEVFGSQGALAVGNRDTIKVQVLGANSTHNDLVVHQGQFGRYEEAYLTEIVEFVDCILQDREPLTTGADGKLAVEIGYKAKESFTKKCIVKI
jgi:myo-inositol 2-dehydrogenase/D-chiro-inositol 1-dehydrogenase